MDRRKTPESIKAEEITKVVRGLERPFSISFDLTGLKSQPIYDRLRHEFARTGILFAIRGTTMFASTKNIRKDKAKLRNIIKRLMLSTEDTQLFEQALEVLHGTQ